MVLGMDRIDPSSQDTLGTFRTARNRMSDSSIVLNSSQERIIHAMQNSNLDFNASLSDTSHSSKASGTKNSRLTHKRTVSNPFGVLYDSFAPPNKSNLAPSSSMTPRYLQIEKAITSGTQPAASSHILYSHPNISRNGSIISTKSMIRNRNVIKNRNKMVRKTDLQQPSSPHSSIFNQTLTRPSSKQKPARRVRYLFPVKRQSSLKEKPSYTKLNSISAKFNSRAELEEFFVANDIGSLIKELLPGKMQVFHYSNLVNVKPTLTSTTKNVKITNNNSFIIEDAPPLVISAPLKETFVKTGGNPNETRLIPLHKKTCSAVDTRPIELTAYEKYREQAFSQKFMIPPRFQDLFPQDINTLTEEQIDEINRKLLLEILIRRTVAAKIEYRLKNSGWDMSKKTSKESNTSSSYSDLSSSSSSSEDNTNRSHSSHNSLPRLESSSDAHTDEESINTDDLMQQNASLFSELLPSPQISYASDIFGSEFGVTSDNNDHPDPVVSHYSPLASKASKQTLLNSLQDSRAFRRQKSREPHIRNESNPDSSNAKIKSEELLYVNDFNKTYFAQNKNKLDDVEKTLFNSTVYLLKPMNRSFATLSSSNDSINRFKTQTPIVPTTSSSGSPITNESRHDTESGYEKTVSTKVRNSQSTANTSILKGLEDLASELSSYVHSDDEKNMAANDVAAKNYPPLHHTPLALQNFTFPEQGPSSPPHPAPTSETLIESIRKQSASGPLEIHPTIPKQATAIISSSPIDIESLQGSLHATNSISSRQTALITDQQHMTSSLNPILESSKYNIKEYRLSPSNSGRVIIRPESYRGSITSESKFSSESSNIASNDSIVSQDNKKFLLMKNRQIRNTEITDDRV